VKFNGTRVALPSPLAGYRAFQQQNRMSGWDRASHRSFVCYTAGAALSHKARGDARRDDVIRRVKPGADEWWHRRR